ncbi:polyprenyl synthetase family protein [Actinomadura livida]|uniref:Heptaprenyl diphosphate synthase n=1 Tax=Actinomadura livida TaxID=79909 RepID=A0A7W7ICY6_9ACTN|nr:MULTISPECIES: polyprenyl synthetase family protein [Actinomadura]MBB4774793.1 heptaprenyl diphosphate synthase [Actinomadura catellatispora]GGU05967.1 hypothetical protein GCM10010208_32800 [Actinomadura livida]
MTTEEVAARLTVLAAALPRPLREPVRSLVARPGKLLRPRLLLACARLGAPEPSRVVRLAAVVELLHLASLLHDDVVDKAGTRRGGPAAHAVVGAEQAMLAGLAVFALAGTEAADLGAGASTAVARAAAAVSYGEMLDVERAFDTMLPIEDYVELVERKTGDLFRLCCRLGATEAGIPPQQVRAVIRFGSALGVAFQILDDCLEMESDHDPGKPTGSDHGLGLFGAPTLLALRADESGGLARLLLAPDFGPDAMAAVRGRVAGLGGVAAARGLSRDWRARAVAALGDVPDGPARSELVRFADGLVAGAR